jgi:hypothetical protein
MLLAMHFGAAWQFFKKLGPISIYYISIYLALLRLYVLLARTQK